MQQATVLTDNGHEIRVTGKWLLVTRDGLAVWFPEPERDGDTLSVLYELIGCTNVEAAAPPNWSLTAWCDGEALLCTNGEPAIPNYLASHLVKQAIVGDVVFSGPADPDGYSLSIPTKAHDRLARGGMDSIQARDWRHALAIKTAWRNGEAPPA